MRVNPGLLTSTTSTEKWLAALAAGQAFAANGAIAASPGNISIAQLKNPVGSGKTLLVRTTFITISVAGLMAIGLYDVDLTSDGGAGINLLSGGAAGVAHFRFQQPAAGVGTTILQFSLQANTVFTPPFEWFAQLAPGQGLITWPLTVNVQNTTCFQWLEQ